mmetsp:Transcript_4421/g.6734  ORF Transcript_4421/g.6734 Transcript_4421/m.6734 type:complete len:125 (-) Transcript_4421:219-593(-)
MDAFFAPDHELGQSERPRRCYSWNRFNSTGKKPRSRSRKVFVKIDELEIKVSLIDIERICGVEYAPAATIGKYGICVNIIPKKKDGKRGEKASAFFVGQSINLSVLNHTDKYWDFKIEPCDGAF